MHAILGEMPCRSNDFAVVIRYLLLGYSLNEGALALVQSLQRTCGQDSCSAPSIDDEMANDGRRRSV